MNKIFLLFLACGLMSCASSNALSFIGEKNASVILENHPLQAEPEKQKKDDKTVVLLNQLFNSDAANKNTVLVINNESDCDFVMHILGGKSYALPVGSKKTESIVVEKGAYVMKSDVCKAPYQAHKTLSDNTQVNIKYSVVKNPESDKLAIIQ